MIEKKHDKFRLGVYQASILAGGHEEHDLLLDLLLAGVDLDKAVAEQRGHLLLERVEAILGVESVVLELLGVGRLGRVARLLGLEVALGRLPRLLDVRHAFLERLDLLLQHRVRVERRVSLLFSFIQTSINFFIFMAIGNMIYFANLRP